MNTNTIIGRMAAYGFIYAQHYCTNDVCFEYDGCRRRPLQFSGWEQVEAFVAHLENNTDNDE